MVSAFTGIATLEELNAAHLRALPADRLVPDLFAEQARSTPDATAVVADDLDLTYDDFDCRANRLAHFLRARHRTRGLRCPLPRPLGRRHHRRARCPRQVVDPDPQFGWADLATDGIAVYEIPGNHRTMWREPSVRVLAATLKRCLADAQDHHAAESATELDAIAPEATVATRE